MNVIEELTRRLNERTPSLWQKAIVLKRNEFLTVNGKTDTNAYFIQSGTLRIFIQNEEEEHTIRFGYQGSIFASLDSFFTGLPSEYYVQAIKQCELQVMSKANFETFLQEDIRNQQLWQKMLELLVCQSLEREKDLLTRSPFDRFKRVFERSPHLFQEIPNKYIANYLRMTPETLSRLKNKI